MALRTRLSIPSNIISDNPDDIPPPVIYESAYARVLQIRVHKERSFIVVEWFENEAARLAEQFAVKTQEFALDTQSLPGDVYTATYNYLKTLPEFEGAQDC